MRASRSFRFETTALALLLCTSSASLFAQANLLANPGFDTELSGWENTYARSADWVDSDAGGNANSGSVDIGNVGTSNGGTPIVLTQCLPAAGSTKYLFGGQVNESFGQPVSTSGQVWMITYDAADCGGDYLQLEALSSTSALEWELLSGSVTTDAATMSLHIGIGVFKPNGVSDDAVARFDNLYLREAGTSAVRVIDERLSGSWYNPATPGQGFFLSISAQTNLFFGGWFTWTDTPGQIDWLTVQGGFGAESAPVTVYRTSGGVFNDPTPVITTPIGAATFRFFSCTTGEVDFAFEGGESGTIPIERLGPAFGGCVD